MESFCQDIVSALETTGEYEQRVFCFNDKKTTIEEKENGVTVLRIGIQKIVFSQPIAKSYGKYLKRTIAEFQPDIIHFMYPNPFAAHFLLEAHYKGLLHLDWICDIVKQKKLKVLFKSQNRRLLKRADYVSSITPTYFENTDYLPKYKGSKGFIACRISDNRTTITDEQKKEAEKIKEKYGKKKIVFFFGRHTEYKGLRYLIDADQYLDQENIQIVIAGQGELTQKLKKQAEGYHNIEFVGRLSDNDINSYLIACNIFAFPSITRNEAFGISLAEAMYFGKPACTFTIPGSGVNWVCLNGKTGLEAPNKDVKKYAQNIMRLALDQDLYRTLSQGAVERCNLLFTKDVFDKKVISVYKEISEGLRNQESDE